MTVRQMEAARAHARSGQHRAAALACRAVLADIPDHPEALHLLGSLVHMGGDHVEALALMRRAVATDLNRAEFHNDLGTVECDAGQLQEAADSYRRALTLRPDFAQAHNNLGTVLAELGDWSQAIVHYRYALALVPDFAQAHANLGNALREEGHWADAEAAYRQALTLAPRSSTIWSNMALLYLLAGETAAALAAIGRALVLDDNGANRALAGRILRTGGTHASPEMLLRALTEGWCRPGDLCAPVLSFLRSRHGCAIEALFNDPLFSALLVSSPVCDPEMEKLLTKARRTMLEDIERPWSAPTLAFHAALAQQCFINGYVFVVSAEEEEAVAILGTEIQHVVARAAYRPLHAMPEAATLCASNWPRPVADLLKQQVGEPLEELKLRETIKAITPIHDETSLRVREQYEAHPYPRWTRAARPGGAMSLTTYLRSNFPRACLVERPVVDVLVAGCGTGRSAIECAQLLPGANILALDLSLASLSYAKRKARELGVNITFAHGDLLALSEQKFDFISAGGVLHHLHDPLGGWRALTNLLRPGGFMQVGLYSALARRSLEPARRLAGLARSDAGIRQARQAILAQPQIAEPLLSMPDFYSINECRDMLFHEQESLFTLREIEHFLSRSDQRFIGMDVDERMMRCFQDRFLGGENDLSLWHSFEQDNPNAFIGMYQCWTQRQ